MDLFPFAWFKGIREAAGQNLFEGLIMRRRPIGVLLLVGILAVGVPLHAGEQPALPWDTKVLFQAPKTHPAPGIEAEGVRALFYDGLPWKGKPTKVFAWYGVPTAKSGEKFPAMVLVHGGGGTAFDGWVRLWTGRGYAAIAMDTCGCVPKGKARHEAGGPPGWDNAFKQIDEPVQDQWPYHAVADVVLAHSLLRSFPEIDPDRIGLTGISWGGYLTCIAAGVDSRFKFAAPVYGCGFLGDHSVWKPQFDTLGSEKAATWLRLWDPSVYLPRAAMPMLWVTGTNDFAYPMDSLQKSYRLPTGPRTLCLRVRMAHAHGPGQTPEEIRVFADGCCKGGAPLPRITAQGTKDGRAWATVDPSAPIAKAELAFTTIIGPINKRKWETAPARLDAAAGRVEADLPEGVTAYYLILTDSKGLVVSTEHAELEREPARPAR
jgi:cephalosporin-C deacetylase-like acetyl esterase